MAIFYLHVVDELTAVDGFGLELPDLEAAKDHAMAGVRDLIAEHVLAGKPICKSHCIEIADRSGHVLHTLQFGDAFEVR